MFFEIIKNMLPSFPVNLRFPLSDSQEPFGGAEENLDYLFLGTAELNNEQMRFSI